MTDYHFPFWRRGVFVALLILVLAMALVPPFAKGTVNIHVFNISTPAPILHFYLTVSLLELHTAGLPSGIGWVTVSWSDNPPKLDLAGQNGQSTSGALLTSPIQSGRYDQVRISISFSSIAFAGGNHTSNICQSCNPISANATVPVPPNGYGDLFLLLSPDYESLLSTPPSLALSLVQVSTPER